MTMPRRYASNRKRKRSPYYPLRKFTDVRVCLRRMRQMPTVEEWNRLLMEEAAARFYTKTDSAAAIGLTREGYRRKLQRMGLG